MVNRSNRLPLRSDTGQASTVLNFMFAVFVLLMIGVFAWELSLYVLAKNQLKTCVEVAALTCSTTLVSSGDPTNPVNQTNAQNTAVNLFAQNSILGTQVHGSPLQATSLADLAVVAPKEAKIFFQTLDPVTRSPSQVIGVNGAIIEADGAYCYQPLFGRFLGLTNVTFTVQVSAQAGLPRLDVVVCFDISGVGDDGTNVTFVQRFWDYQNTPPHITYMIPWIPGSSQYAQGSIMSLGCFPGNTDPNTINVNQPKNNSSAETVPPSCQLQYAENGHADLLTGLTLNSAPPGNYCKSSTSSMVPGEEQSLEQKRKIAHRKIRHHGVIAFGIHKPKGDSLTSTSPQPLRTDVSFLPTNVVAKEKLKLCSNPNLVGDKELEDTFVNLNRDSDSHSLFSKFSPLDILGSSVTTTGPSTGDSGTIFKTENSVTFLCDDLGPTNPPTYGITKLGPHNACSGQSNPPTGYVSSTSNPFLGFTDMVANLDGKSSFGGGTFNGYNFTHLATLVEAERGNLENVNAATGAGVDTTGMAISPQAGYQTAYIQAAYQMTQPMQAMISGVQSFLDEVYRVADVHYGFVAFNGIVGSSINTTFNKPNWDYNYLPAGTGDFPVPMIALNPAQGVSYSNYSNLTGVLNGSLITNNAEFIYGLAPYGRRGTALALKTAISQLNPANSQCRPWANKAIILVTDGSPTNDLSGNFNTGSALADAVSQASIANSQGIPIYVVYVNMSSIDPGLNQVAYDENTVGSICATAGHDSKAYSVTWQDNITTTHDCVRALGNVARRLAGLLR